jgi:hypothetical protein
MYINGINFNRLATYNQSSTLAQMLLMKLYKNSGKTFLEMANPSDDICYDRCTYVAL